VTVVFHVLAGGAIAHVAAVKSLRRADGRIERPSLWLTAGVGVASVLSHGLLDGLKHGYPIPPSVTIVVGTLLGLAWVVAVRPPLAVLFAVAIGGAVAPDVIDLGPEILRSRTSIDLRPSFGRVFPWHWWAGSGSMSAGDHDPARDLRVPQNQIVSYANHAIVIILSLGCIGMSPWAFRGTPWRGREVDAPAPQIIHGVARTERPNP
jgi:hypothetical protein